MFDAAVDHDTGVIHPEAFRDFVENCEADGSKVDMLCRRIVESNVCSVSHAAFLCTLCVFMNVVLSRAGD